MAGPTASRFYDRLRPWLFRLDSEEAHRLSVRAMELIGSDSVLRRALYAVCGVPDAEPAVFCGLSFPNRVGLAAGYDKDGLGWRGLACLGFGHVEVGTVTPRPQPGNPRPRIFRLVEDESLINRLGFPGEGAAVVAERLVADRPHGVVLGVNIGKNKDTPNDQAARDYCTLVETFAPKADYLVVNVSSPNTEGLRRLQTRRALEALLTEVMATRDAHRGERPLPVLVKLSPDLDDVGLDDALEAIDRSGIDGVIATNTTVSRPGLSAPAQSETGGLSGRALRDLATEMIGKIHRRTAGKLPMVGVGGILGADDVKARLDAGASLVQIYTGLVYRGPLLVRDLLQAL